MRIPSDLIWICGDVLFIALTLGIAVLMVRHRRSHRWLILAGAVVYSASAALTTTFFVFSLLEWDTEGQPWMRWLSYNGLANISGLVLFLLGIFLQSLRQAGESARIAELEAILHDQHRPIPPGDER